MKPSRVLVAALLCTLFVAPARASVECPEVERPVPSPTGLSPGYNDPRPAYGWVGGFASCEVTLDSARTGARLYGVLHFPRDIAARGAPLPGVVIGPGSGQGVQANYHWLARALAAGGYMALTVDPQGVGYSETTALQGEGDLGLDGIPFQQLENYIDALRSGLDFLGSDRNPLAAHTRNWGHGLAGHSLSARAASTLQGTDERVAAIVALDNLSSNREGDAGIMSGDGFTGGLAGGEVALTNTPNIPRVPALALASDQSPWVDATNTDPELKKTGYRFWRNAGTPAMVIVFRGSGHSDFSRKPGDDLALHEPAAAYAQAWLDRYLKQPRAGTSTLMSPRIAGRLREDLLSPTFRSAQFLPDDGIDCPDLRAGRCTQAGATGQGGGAICWLLLLPMLLMSLRRALLLGFAGCMPTMNRRARPSCGEAEPMSRLGPRPEVSGGASAVPSAEAGGSPQHRGELLRWGIGISPERSTVVERCGRVTAD